MAANSNAGTRTTQQRWLMIQRLIISTFLLFSLFALKAKGGEQELSLEWFGPGLAALGIYYVLSILYYYLPDQGVAGGFLRVAQVASDLALAICLTMITGGGDSPFSFLFILVIINSSFLGGIQTALIVATFSAALWAGMVTLQDSGALVGWVPDLKLREISGSRLVRILINTGACYLVAFLSGYLAGQLFLSRRALVSSQVRLDRLADLNENIIQSIDSGLITMDHSGLILTVNRAGLDIFGRTLSEMRGRPWQMFLPQLEHILPRALTTRRGASGLRFEFLRESDRLELLLELNVLALQDQDGELWGRLLVLKDLTSLSQMEEAVHKAERLASLGELAAGLAHELRTPLASMTGAWHMLSEQSPDPEDQRRLISIVGREMDRLAKLTKDFLSFARPARANPSVFDLGSLVSDQLKLFDVSHRQGITVATRLELTPPVFFDPDQLRQVIWNLLANALEAGEQQDRLCISVETGADPGWPDYVALRIINDGPGIPHANLPKIFEPFFTTKSTGNGLGLATINRILHEGQAHIIVNSSHTGPTVFTVLLPRAGA